MNAVVTAALAIDATPTNVKAEPIWLLSPYHTGSHQAWAQGYAQHSRYQLHLLTMAGRFWKWRMQGGAATLAQLAQEQLAVSGPPAAIITTDMVNLPAWLGLMRRALPANVPIVHYMHENQLTYPWQAEAKPDFTYAMINWLSQLAADRVAFNSHYHAESWFAALPALLQRFPDYQHLAALQRIREISAVLPVGIACTRFLSAPARQPRDPNLAPLILWNQRWEHDKRPDRFFQLLYRLQAVGAPFRLAVAGEHFRQAPPIFAEAKQRLADHIVHWGYLAQVADYIALLHQADLVISTTDHEFFGISMVEAMVAGAFPLLPNRLSYPELVPPALHSHCLYADEADLFDKSLQYLQQPHPAPPELCHQLRQRYDWPVVAATYDALIDALVHQ